MKQGKGLNNLIAEKVMGKTLLKSAFHHDFWVDRVTGAVVKSYSTDISAAMEVVETLQALERPLTLNRVAPDKWEAIFWDNRNGGMDEEITAVGETAPEAICLAALRVAVPK